jgi:hypothetical protein
MRSPRRSCSDASGVAEPVSRRSSRRGRPYQPLPERRVNWGARLVVIFVAFFLIAGIAILSFTR